MIDDAHRATDALLFARWLLRKREVEPTPVLLVILAQDEALAHHNGTLPRLEEFILPAGNRAASQAHVCRTVARRAERAVVALGQQDPLRDTPRQYLNRLSDLMFVLARVCNRMNGGDDVYWKSERMTRNTDG